jgi:NADPH2:quinone reductase
MRAAVCHRYGPPEGIQVKDIPPPALTAGHLRVRVGTAAVNFPDVLLMANRYQVSIPVPFVPGSEFAGVVEETAEEAGEAAGGFAAGDRVMGTMIAGAFAEEAVVAASSVTRIPPDIDDRSAAAFGVAHRTAYHVLRSVAAVHPGEQLVVLGAGGGVGLAAVQLGSVLGATVTAVASSAEKLEVAASYGATGLIRHQPGDLRQALREALPDGADVVVDPVGGDLAEPALRALRWGGRFVTVGYASGAVPRIPLNLVLLKGVRILGFQLRDFAANAPRQLRRNEQELLALLAARRALPHIGASFKLTEAAAALRHVADGKAIGKVVLEVSRAAGR